MRRSLMICTSYPISLGVKSRRMRWVGHVICVWESTGVYRVLVWKPVGEGPVIRPRHRWEHDIKMDLQEVGYEGMDWISVAQDRDNWRALVVVMNVRSSIKCGEFD
jgi:hypothetical protein